MVPRKAVYIFGWHICTVADQAACHYRAAYAGGPVGAYCAIAYDCDVVSVTNDLVPLSITVFEVEGCEVGLTCIWRVGEVDN
jgi:hypothetical protein